ncbi:hypothetical protein BCR42DRAFT_352908 [Absidia repens]|uniref:Kinesin motor domain-containing protein n=1 Tax=Absidia repens TaxID=90262 RepID=A0A1X2IGH1_9FUNG|nr:hypothetical protein BCR42DRAFT_352908 [Absidia repens]
MTNTINLPSPTISIKDSQTTAVQVAIRVRPLTQQDRSQPRFSHSSDSDVIKTFGNTVTIVPHQKSFNFDYVFDTESTQDQVFTGVASNLVDRFLDGYNATILAYGQTSSGKTHTIMGSTDPDQEGIIPRAMSAFFQRLHPTTTPPSPPTSLSRRPTSSTATSISASSSASSSHSTFPPASSGLRLPRRAVSSTKLRPISMIATNNSNSSNGNGSNSSSPLRRGSAPAAQDDVSDKATRHTVHVSFVEIYNEELIDLLNPAPPNERPPATIREDTKGHIHWTGVKEVAVNSTEDVLRHLQIGTDSRATGSTDMNAKSSRSHAIFSVTLKQEKWVPTTSSSKSSSSIRKREVAPSPVSTRSSISGGMNRRASCLNVKAMVGQMEQRQGKEDDEDGEWMILHSKFHFVDLAGSERLKRTAAEGDRRKEGININAGLLALGNVISALASDPSHTNRKAAHIPYRDSKLTRLLQDSLGGNATTLMIACISPAELNLTETANTVKYAHRARSIKNKAERNEAEDWMTNDSPDFLRTLITKLKTEIRTLKSTSSHGATAAAINGNHRKTNASSSPTTSHSSSTEDEQPLPPSPSPSAVLNSTQSDSVDFDHSQLLVVSDLRRQIEELHNELTVTRERNQWVESQLGGIKQQNQQQRPLTSNCLNSSSSSLSHTDDVDGNNKQQQQHSVSRGSHSSHDSAVGSLDFQHLVEPVIEEYEKSISGLESQLALARAALTHSDEALVQQETKMAEYEALRDQERKELADLQALLLKATDREQSTELYIQKLESKVAKSEEDASRDQDTLIGLKNKIIQFQDMDATTEQYIHTLETKLAKAQEDQDRWNVLGEAAEQRLVLQQEHVAALQQKLDSLDTTMDDETQQLQQADMNDDQHQKLLVDMEVSQSQCLELKATLDSIKRHSVMSESVISELQVGTPSNTRNISENDTACMDGSSPPSSLPSASELQEHLEQKEAYVATLEKRLEEIGALHQELADLREEHAQAMADLESQLETLKENHSQVEKDLRAQYDQAQSTIMDLTTQVAKEKQDHQTALDKHTELQQQLWDHEQGTQITLRLRLNEMEQLKLDISALHQVESKQEQIIRMFEQKMVDMDQAMAQLQKQLVAKDEHVKHLEEENQQKTEWVHAMQKDLQSVLRDMATLGMERKKLDLIVAWMDKSLQRQDNRTMTSLVSLTELQQLHKLRDADYEARLKMVETLEARVQELSSSVEKGDASTRRLTLELTDAKAALVDEQQKQQDQDDPIIADIDAQRLAALESRIVELDHAMEQATKDKADLDQALETKQNELQMAQLTIEKQSTKLALVEQQLKETMASMEKERGILAANDTTGMIAELEDKLQVLQRARQLDQDEYDLRFDRAMDDLDKTQKAYKEQTHVVTSLEESLQAMQERLDEAVASHSKKSCQLQQLQDQLHRRRQRSDSMNSNSRWLKDVEEERDVEEEALLSSSPPPPSASSSTSGVMAQRQPHQTYDVTSLLRQLTDQETLLRDKDMALMKLQQQVSSSRTSSPLPSRSTSTNALSSVDRMEHERHISKQNQDDIKDSATREEMLEQLQQFANDKTQLMMQVDDLETQLTLQRTQFSSETKNLEMELMKLSAANDRMEKEMEQVMPRHSLPPPISASVSSGPIFSGSHGSNGSTSLPFTSPPQTPRVASPPPAHGFKLHRDLSANSLSKLQNGTSYRALSAMDYHHSSSYHDDLNSTTVPRPASQTMRSSADRPGSMSSTTSSYIGRSATIPPPSAPPSNPLPPIPTTPLPAIPTQQQQQQQPSLTSSASSSSIVSSPTNSQHNPVLPAGVVLQRTNSTHTTGSLVSDMSLPNSQQSTQTTAEQFDKMLRSLQRKAQVAESDVRAHQDVISKLEHQLSRSETSVRDVKKQLEVLNKEKQAYSLEIKNLRSQVTQIMSQQKSSVDEAGERRKQLEQSLEQERRLKEKAEKGRLILENRMEELMTKKNKFMCF